MNKTQKIKKNKHGKIILIFITIMLLILFIGSLSKTSEVKSEEFKKRIQIVDTNERYKKMKALVLDTLLEDNNLPKHLEYSIAAMKGVKAKTLLEVSEQIANINFVEWTLEYYYSLGYQITCVIGNWIILDSR